MYESLYFSVDMLWLYEVYIIVVEIFDKVYYSVNIYVYIVIYIVEYIGYL